MLAPLDSRGQTASEDWTDCTEPASWVTRTCAQHPEQPTKQVLRGPPTRWWWLRRPASPPRGEDPVALPCLGYPDRIAEAARRVSSLTHARAGPSAAGMRCSAEPSASFGRASGTMPPASNRHSPPADSAVQLPRGERLLLLAIGHRPGSLVRQSPVAAVPLVVVNPFLLADDQEETRELGTRVRALESLAALFLGPELEHLVPLLERATPADQRALLQATKALPAYESPLTSLPPQQRRVLEGIAEGLGNRGIAERLGLSEKTVRNYVSIVLRRLNLRNRAEAAVWYLRHRGEPQFVTVVSLAVRRDEVARSLSDTWERISICLDQFRGPTATPRRASRGGVSGIELTRMVHDLDEAIRMADDRHRRLLTRFGVEAERALLVALRTRVRQLASQETMIDGPPRDQTVHSEPPASPTRSAHAGPSLTVCRATS
jgi:DNA-binding CsgD family transcriptional regulator